MKKNIINAILFATITFNSHTSIKSYNISMNNNTSSFMDYVRDFSIIGGFFLGLYSAIKVYYLNKSFEQLTIDIQNQQAQLKYVLMELNADKNTLIIECQKLAELVAAITSGTAHKNMTAYQELLNSQRTAQEKLSSLVKQYNTVLNEYERNFRDLNINTFTLMLSNLHNEQNSLHREIIKLESHIDKISSKMDSKSLDERFARIEEIFQNGKIDKIYRELCSLRDKMNLLMR